MKIKTETHILPAHWACYIINADSSGLNDDDIAECDKYCDTLKGHLTISSDDESYFTHTNDAGTLACDVIEYTEIIPILDKFQTFKQKILPEISELIKLVIPDIDDDCRATDDPEDETPSIQITIGCNADLELWSYQTGDNSFTGGCYGSQFWGVGYLTRDCNPIDTASEMIDQMLEQIEE